MKKILIICYVAAEFVLNGERFSVTPNKIGTFIEAPEWIRDTVMFKWLVKDGSLKVSNEHITKKQGENDPMKGVSAEGKAEEISKAAEDKLMKPAKEPEKEQDEALVKEKKTTKEPAPAAETEATDEEPAAVEEKPAKAEKAKEKKEKAAKDDAK